MLLGRQALLILGTKRNQYMYNVSYISIYWPIKSVVPIVTAVLR